MYVEPDSYLRPQLRYLQAVGIWPLDSNNRVLQTIHKVSTAYLIVTLAYLSFGQLVQMCLLPGLEEMSSAIDLWTLTTSGLYKMIFYMAHQKKVKTMVNKVNTTFFAQSSDGSVTMRHWLRNSTAYTLGYMSCAVIVAVVWVLSPVIDMYTLNVETEQSHETGSLSAAIEPFCNETYANSLKDIRFIESTPNNNSSCRLVSDGILTTEDDYNYVAGNNDNFKFPVNCWYPFDVTWSPLFETVFIMEVVTLFGVAHLYIAMDCLFFGVIYTICGQLEILKASLVHLHSIAQQHRYHVTADYRKDVSKECLHSQDGTCQLIETKLNSELIKCIEFHTIILEYLRELEEMASSLIAVDVLHAIISLSFAMLQTSISVSFSEWVKMVLFVIACVWHQFLNNYFTEAVIQKQIQVVEAAYDTPWVDRPEPFKRSVRIIMMRAYRPVVFNAFKLYYLGHTTFMEFMRALVSYFMVLRELQGKK